MNATIEKTHDLKLVSKMTDYLEWNSLRRSPLKVSLCT